MKTKKRNSRATRSTKQASGGIGILIVIAVFAAFFLLLNLYKQQNGGQTIGLFGTGTPAPAQTYTLTAPYTVGYVGCSNSHDTIEGYHAAPGSAHIFWPFGSKTQYPIEGKTIVKWAHPEIYKDQSGRSIWDFFDQMKTQYNAGKDPVVVWVQLCEDLSNTTRNYYQSTYNDVVALLNNLKAHAPTSTVYISPLHSYDPIDLCPLMGPGGLEQQKDTIPWSNQAVAAGLALAGPGAGSNANLGPLTVSNTYSDRCHPSGPAHGTTMPGSGEQFLGTQLMNFFDPLFKAH